MTNRRGPTRVFAGRLPTICLLVIITTSTSVSAFSFWSSSMLGKVIKPQALLTRPTQAAAATQQSTGARHSQITTTSSTTTTTTQMPLQPLELHFEINPEGLTYERGDGPEVAWNKTSEELSSSSAIANGSLILEDLVNQFARNFQAGELKFRSASNKTVDNLSEFAAEPTTPQMSMQLLDEPNHVDHSTSDPDADGRPTVTSSFEPTSHDSLVEPPAEEPDPDRHIQYDMTNLFTNVDSATSAATTHQALQAHDRSANSSASTDVRFAGQDSNQTRRQPSPPTLTVSHILTNVTIPTQTTTTTAQGAHHPPERRNHLLSTSSLENDTSILDTAMSSNSSRAPATTNLLQARSMSPGSSGHLSSLSNHRPPPVVGQKPPYASSYQLHHRNAIGPSDFVSRDASQNSSYGQVAPPLQKRQDQMASATTTNGELTNSINSISSSLLISDSQQSSQTTTSTTTTAKPPPHAGLAQTLQNYLAATAASDNYAGFSERQDNERAEELERVANKLAPSELTELNPIESPSLMNSAHQLHYQPDQVFPADIGSSPADSNSVIVSNYHHSAADHHYTPQLASSGLSEPANSMSSYLQAQQRQQSGSVDTTSGGELNKRAHDAKGGAPAAGLASTTTTTTSGNDGRDDRVNSPQVQVHRRTIETLSNQIAHADGNLAASANTLAVHQHRERSPPSAHDGRGVPNSNYHNHQHQGNSYAASLINVTAPMVLPLSATEAMEAALSDPAARQMMHHVGGGSLTLMQAGDQDQRYSSAAHAQTTTPPPQRSSYYVIPPPPSDHTTGGGGLHHLSIYSRAPAQNQFRPGASATTSSTTPASSTAGGDTQSPYELERERMRLGDGGYLLQQQAQVAPGSQQASGFRSPFGQYPASVTAATAHMLSPGAASAGVPTPSSYLSGMSAPSSTSSPQSGNKFVSSTPASIISTTNATSASTSGGSLNRFAPDRKQQMMNSSMATTTNGFITSGISNSSSSGSTSLAGIVVSTASSDMATAGTGSQQQTVGQVSSQQPTGGSGGGGSGLGKRVFNLTRVEHISAECSNDLIRTIIIFNGTFKGIIYSSGYVRDSNCLYVNGTGKTRYDFSIKLNQCGTLGRQEIHPAGGGPGGDGLRRRDQVMWNTLSIQYNPIIEQEWDEHFRVSCEYGSDFWKTISFSPFNVETNTGSPVVFTVDPPQCQMEILKGHGMVGPRQETITGPVTVGDPLTLLIHMKSEKAGYDILVKNCVAHNGGQQKMQLIDTNGCVVNERFISPFRGTYNDNDLKHVTLYSYLKAFRFTGSPVLYLECEVHMCQSACPPQMCYWRRLSKRSTSGGHLKSSTNNTIGLLEPYDDHSSLEEFDVSHGHSMNRDMDSLDDDHEGATTRLGQSQYVKTIRFNATASTTTEGPPSTRRQASRQSTRQGRGLRSQEGDKGDKKIGQDKRQENLSDSISLFQALEVRQEREDPNTSGESGSALASQRSLSSSGGSSDLYEITGISNSGDASQLMCYQRIEIFAFLFTVASILLAALSVTIGCYYRASSLRRVSLAASSAAHQHHYDHHHQRALGRSKQRHLLAGPPTHPGRISGSLSLSSANMCYSPFSSSSVSSSTSPSACSPTSCESSGASPPGNHSAITGRANYLLLDQNLHFNPAASSHGRDGGGATLATNNRLQQQQPGGNNINLNEIGAALRSLHHLAAPQPTKRQPGL